MNSYILMFITGEIETWARLNNLLKEDEDTSWLLVICVLLLCWIYSIWVLIDYVFVFENGNDLVQTESFIEHFYKCWYTSWDVSWLESSVLLWWKKGWRGLPGCKHICSVCCIALCCNTKFIHSPSSTMQWSKARNDENILTLS